MGLFDWFKWGKKAPEKTYAEKDAEVVEAVKLAVQDLKLSAGGEGSKATVSQAVKNMVRSAQATLQRKGSSRSLWENAEYQAPLYDLQEIGKIVDVESYFAASVRRHRELIMKEGWKITGRDEETVKYVKRRLTEIAYITGEPFAATLREIVTNLVQYGSVPIILKRDVTRSSGN